MNMLEKWFDRSKHTGTDGEKAFQEQSSTEEIKTQEKKEPKTLQKVKEAVADLRELSIKRHEKLEKHRDTVDEIRQWGVRDSNGTARSETARDILGPIEEELVAISKEINEKRETFDLQPNRKEVIETRQFRLGQLKHRVREEFASTPSGRQIAYWDAQRGTYHQQNDLYQKEIQEIDDLKEKFFQTDKVAKQYFNTMQRIEYLEAELDHNLRNSKHVDYDENGLERIEKTP